MAPPEGLELAGFVTGGAHPLYAVCHLAYGDDSKGVVVVVPPFAEEHKAAQRALVEMARNLAEAQWHAIRFDLSGTGDSGGEFGGATITGWLADLQLMLQQAHRMADGKPLVLLGLRLGATLAWLAAKDADVPMHGLALWEPIVSGSAYMRQNRQRSQIRRELTREASASEEAATPPQQEAQQFPPIDFDGFAISSAMHRELAAIDLLQEAPPRCRAMLILQVSGAARFRKPLEDLRERARTGGAFVELDNIPVEPFWSAIGLVETAPVQFRTSRWLWELPDPDGPSPETGKSDWGRDATTHWPPESYCHVAEAITAEPFSFCSGDQTVHGVLYRPEAPTERAVLLLHGWSGYRVGPGHLLTETARALAQAGCAAYSFDFRGRGESEWEVGQASLNSMIRDASRAIPVVLEHTGASRVTLLGLCSGAEVALGAALSDARVDSLALWSAPVFSGDFTVARQARRSRAAAAAYLRKLLYPETWSKLATGRLNYRAIARALSGGRSSEDAAVVDKAPDTGTQMAQFRAFKGRLLFVYGTNDPETDPSREFYQRFMDETHMPAEFLEVHGANHNYYSMQWKQAVISATLVWLDTR